MVISLLMTLMKSTGIGSLCTATTPSLAPFLAAVSAALMTAGAPAASR